MKRILFLCTGNSARSILAEAVLNRLGDGQFEAHSAGSAPKGAVHPDAVDLLESRGYPTGGLRSKSWDEFAGPGAPPLDFVITLCDSAAAEACPLWLGKATRVHWGLPDPAAEGSTQVRRAAFADTLQELTRRLHVLSSLPPEKLGHESIRRCLEELAA
ncbi:MAG: arsenate reductase ArsC [Candidatus Binatia bacterium]